MKTSDPPRRNTYSCTAPRLSWPPRLRFWRSPPHRLLRRHLVSSPAPTRWDRPAVNDPAMLRSTPHLAHCLGFCRPPSTPGGVLSDTAHGSRNTDLTRSGRHSAITRNTAGFSLAPPFCGLLNFRSRPMPPTPAAPQRTPGNAQLTARIGLAAQQSDPPQFPSSGTTTNAGGASTYQKPGDAQITALPGPAAQTAAGQSRFFGRVIGLPRA